MGRLKTILLLGLLISFSNCGSDDDPTATLTAAFKSSLQVIEKGNSIEFTDLSEGNPNSWRWEFEGGEPPTSADQNPEVTYTNPGIYDVKLIVKSGNSTDTIIKADYITVKEKIYELQAKMDIVYGINPDKHILDLYLPKNASSATPLIIMMGGGGFYQGSGRHLLVPFAEIFVPEGIAVASARYRQVSPPSSPDRYQEGIVKSSQDAKAAVRFFRANADEYNINPNLIFTGGNSSGAIGSLVAAYFDWNEIQEFEQNILNKHGGLEGAQGNMSYSSEVAGIVSLSGEMGASIEFIDPSDPPFFGVCTSADNEIACDTRVNSGGFIFYGAIPINAKAKEEGLRSDAFIFDIGTHTTPRERPQDYKEQLISWIQPIINNPPDFDPEPFIYYEDFNAGCLPDGWRSFIIKNEDYDWECQDIEGGSLYINSFSEIGEDNPTENWLITDKISIIGSPNPTLLFDYFLRFNDASTFGLQLFASTTHAGDFNPGEWTPISPVYDQPTAFEWDSDFVNQRIDLSDYTGKDIFLGIRYTSSGSITDKSFELRFDNLRIQK